MKNLQKRSAALWFPTGLVIIGLLFFLVRLFLHGGEWAAYPANRSIYHDGLLTAGTVTDRNGTVLAHGENGQWTFAEDESTRLACLHVVGDPGGNIGTGTLTVKAAELAGYSPLRGTDGRGGTIRLSIDAGLQKTARQAMGGRNGTAIVMNYKTGEILCMVSSPAYDPASGNAGHGEGVYLNRAISAAYPPGSIFKLVTLLAAKETVPGLESMRFTCEGSIDCGKDTVTCTGVHGNISVRDALAWSCNCAFAEIAWQTGSGNIAAYAEKLGLLESLSLDGTATRAGNFDYSAPHTAGEAWSGIGQSTDLVSPYAMARLCAAVANGGTVKEPTLLAGEKNGETRLMSRESAAFLGSCMGYAADYGYGGFNFPGLSLCAKSGTAELGDGDTHAWFIGYLKEGPPLAFAVLLERGGGGFAQAGPAANIILQKAAEICDD